VVSQDFVVVERLEPMSGAVEVVDIAVAVAVVAFVAIVVEMKA
jgi:hypothetical protein